MDVRTGVINQNFPKQTDKDISYLEVELTIPFSMCFFLPCGQLLPRTYYTVLKLFLSMYLFPTMSLKIKYCTLFIFVYMTINTAYLIRLFDTWYVAEAL